jgi:hypothetical protein
VAAAIVVGGLFLLIPITDILGAGIALLIAEVVAAIAYIRYAQRWLTTHGLLWPKKIFSISTAAVYIAAMALIIIILFPQFKWIVGAVSMLLFMLNLWRFWKVLPPFASAQARQFIVNLPGIKRMLV